MIEVRKYLYLYEIQEEEVEGFTPFWSNPKRLADRIYRNSVLLGLAPGYPWA
jgi:hypothetical protein